LQQLRGSMSNTFDLVVIGGGPAGSAAAISAARAGAHVLQLERGLLPRQRVCGEFVSPESLEILSGLIGDHELLHSSQRISTTRIMVDDEVLTLPISPPAASITRYDLDSALWQSSFASGVDCRQNVHVQSVDATSDFRIRTPDESFEARAVVNATGRWSNLRAHEQQNSQPKQLGTKAHFHEADSPQSVDLYFFDGGYCGVQPVAKDVVNVCAVAEVEIATSLDEIFAQHTKLWRRSRGWEQIFSTVSTSPLIFRKPQPAADDVFQVGDSAGFIDPFVGDGISLALRSGVMAVEELMPFFGQQIELTTALASYSKRYLAELVPPFRAASQIRKLFRIPRALRGVTARAIQWSGIGERLVLATR
jgi:flavin-dependent dehydrogenase